MRGHVAKKGSRYYVVVDERDADGQRRRKWHGSWRTRREADAAASEIVGRLHRGEYVSPTKATVGVFLMDAWLPAMETTLKPSTHRLYETLVSAYVVPRIGAVRLQALTPSRLNAFYGELLREGSRRATGGLSPTSARNVHRVLHRALRDAVRWGLIPRNPADLSDPPRTERGPMRMWGAGELRQFLDATRDEPLGPLWLLLATTGLRRAEGLAIRWGDLDLPASRVTIRRSLAYVGSRAVMDEPKTARSRRLVTMPAATVDALRAHKLRQAEQRLAFGPGYAELDLVFCAPDGEPLRPATVSRQFSRRVETAGLPPITLHGLRHGFATLALGAGVPLKVTSEILGHSSMQVTADVYSHVSPTMLEEATERVARVVLG